MNKTTNIYTANFEFFDKLYGSRGEIFDLIEEPKIKERYQKCIQIIEELEETYPDNRFVDLLNSLSDFKAHAVWESFEAGVSETRKLLASFSSLEVDGE